MTNSGMPFTWDEAIKFVYIATFTQTAATGKIDLRFRPGAGNQILLFHGTTGPDDYSGGETVQVEVRTDSGRLALLRKIDTAVDNETLPFPAIMTGGASDGQIQPASNDTPIPLIANLVIQGQEEIRIFTTALAQNETVKVKFTYKSRAGVPIEVDTSDSSGTVTTSTTQHEVL